MQRENGAIGTGFPVFFRLIWRTLTDSKGSAAEFSPRRAFGLVLWAPALLLLEAVHRIGFFLDDLFYRGWRDVEVKQPVFLIGIPRSGTTLLHRLFAIDEDRFTTFLLWELLFAPSIIERKCWHVVGALDRLLGGLGRKGLVAIEDRLFSGMRRIHRVGLFEPEEDEFVLLPIFASIFLLAAFPFLDELGYLIRFDAEAPPKVKARVMAFYKDCIKRHLYVHGPHKQFLSKNPSFSAKVEALNNTFPDCRIVCNVRTPYAAVPSLISLIGYSWDKIGNERQGDQFRDVLMDAVGHFYRHPIECLPNLPPDRHAFLRFDDLTRDPKQTVCALYEQFGFEMGPVAAARLDADGVKAGSFRSRHGYSLAQYGLTPDGVLEQYGDVFEYFGFDTAHGT